MLNPKTFKCKHCGECCKKYLIKLYNSDIKKIKKLNYKENFFIDYDTLDNKEIKILKKINNKCVFLTKKNNKYFCRIYPLRPKICKQYPFFKKNIETCKPLTFSNLYK